MTISELDNFIQLTKNSVALLQERVHHYVQRIHALKEHKRSEHIPVPHSAPLNDRLNTLTEQIGLLQELHEKKIASRRVHMPIASKIYSINHMVMNY